MERFERNGTDKTPYVSLRDNGDFEFRGASLPEDSAKYYFRIMDWISDYYRDPNSTTNLTLAFTYLNSASSSMIFKIFHTLNRLHNSGKSEVSCTWYCDQQDTGMKEFVDHVRNHCPDIDIELREEDSLVHLL